MTSYRINWDALLARVVYRWHWRVALGLLALVAAAGLASGAIPPVWRGEAALALDAAPGATLELDGRPWPRPLYAGTHTVGATWPDGRRAWADVTLRAGETLTLTLPAGLPEPLVRRLPATAPGGQVQTAEWAGGAWRVTSSANAPTEADAPADATPTPVPAHTVAFGPRGAERLSTIDAYAGLADQVVADGRPVAASYRPADRALGGDPAGTITVRGWGDAPTTIAISAELTLLRLAPDGAALLTAERTPGGGEQVSIAQPGAPPAPIVAVPGHVRRVTWRDNGAAAVLHSQSGARVALTLVRLRPTLAAATVAELDDTFAAALVPLTWSGDALVWAASDDAGPALWQAPISTLIPRRRDAPELRAIGARPDGALDALWLEGGRLALGQLRDGRLVGQAVLPGIAPRDDLAGIWHGGELLVHSGDGVWLVTVREEGGS